MAFNSGGLTSLLLPKTPVCRRARSRGRDFRHAFVLISAMLTLFPVPLPFSLDDDCVVVVVVVVEVAVAQANRQALAGWLAGWLGMMDTACFSFVSAGDRARSSRLYPAALAGLSADPRSTNRSKSSGGGVNTPCCLAFSPCLPACSSVSPSSLSYSLSLSLVLSRFTPVLFLSIATSLRLLFPPSLLLSLALARTESPRFLATG